VLACAAVLVLPAVVWGPRLLATLAASGLDARFAALAAALLLFLPPSLAMGMVSPFAVRLSVRQVDRVGSVAGGYSALSTAGSIIGTVLTTFWLIPSFAVEHLLLALAATLAFCSILLAKGRAAIATAVLAAFTCGFAAYARTPPGTISGEKVLLSRDTAYHHIRVSEVARTRYLRFDNLTQTMFSLEHPNRFLSGYEDGLLLSWALRPGIRRVCQIGLGGASFSRAVARLVPDSSIVSVEIDPVVAEIAKEYFEYRESPRVRTVIEDGRIFLARTNETFDLIVLDAYNSTGVPFHLMTREFFETLRKRLTPDGVFAANFIGSLMGSNGRLFWATYKTIRSQFGQVYVGSADLASGGAYPQGTVIVLATVSGDPVDPATLLRNSRALAEKWDHPGIAVYPAMTLHGPPAPPDVPELTDAYAPVEALQHF
jgi:spermidine synthase